MKNTLLVSVLMLSVGHLAVSGAQALTEEQLGGHLKAVTSDSQQEILFPLLKTDIKADIQGDMATVTVQQTFVNPMDTAVHATYLFPLPPEAAVYEMLMEVGSERIRAQIQRIEEAQHQFEQAKQQGRSAALLQQHRPNMFTQDVAHLLPGLPIVVTLSYVQTVNKVDGLYEITIPLVVGPRYQPPSVGVAPLNAGVSPHDLPDAPADKLADPSAMPPTVTAHPLQSTSPFGRWEIEQLPNYPPVSGLTIPPTVDPNRVSLTVHLHGGIPIQTVQSDTHPLAQKILSPENWEITLQAGRVIDNRDVVLRYGLAGEQVQAGLLSYHDERGGFFSLLIEPPVIPLPEQISPREVVFLLDCSGSMYGLPLEASKALAQRLLQRLRPTDTFRIIRFSDAATEFSRRPLVATPTAIQQGLRYLAQLHGEGGTMMSTGIRQALLPPVPNGAVRLILLLTDGYIGNESEILQLTQRYLGSARLFGFGVGTAVNRYLLDEMSRIGRGVTRYLDPAVERFETVVEALSQRLQSPVLTDVRIDWGQLKVSEVTPDPIPDLFAGQAIRLYGRYHQAGDYELVIHGRINGQPARLPLKVTLPERSTHGQAVALTWARAAIAHAMQQLLNPTNDANTLNAFKQQVIQLGLDFSLMTQWTAFIAMSEQIYNVNPHNTPLRPVPLPMVEGVSALAYPNAPFAPAGVTGSTFSGQATPEPAVWGGVVLLGLLLGLVWLTRREAIYSVGEGGATAAR